MRHRQACVSAGLVSWYGQFAEAAVSMAQETAGGPNELEQLQRQFEEYRGLRPTRSRLGPALWKEAAEAAKRYGLNPVAQMLRLDYNRLKKRMAAVAGPSKQKTQLHAAPAFVELIAPAVSATIDCHI